MIPLATTTVSISESGGGDPYETSTLTVVASGISAHISAPTGREGLQGGSQETIDAVLLCDPTTLLTHTCVITDESDSDTYSVAWVRRRRGLGLDHMIAGLRRTSGASFG